jgi:hypothetical protein
MNKLFVYSLKALRKLYIKCFGSSPKMPEFEKDPDKASQIIYDVLISDKPCMIGRFGSNELLCLVTYLGIKENNRNIISYVTGKSSAWWWNQQNLKNMHIVAGFFPPQYSKFEQFCELMLRDIPEVDVLGSWLADELLFEKELNNSAKIWLDFLNPFFAKNPWSRALEGKKVLVLHPFAETIKKQYDKRILLFDNKNVLPDFELQTMKTIQSLGKETVEYKDWFEALHYMQDEIDKRDYDICLIGAGAYGFPLAAHVKRKGKKAIHLGGSLQLLFGIRGKRWEDPNLNKEYCFADYMNQYWVRPSEEETPKNSSNVEGACYW